MSTVLNHTGVYVVTLEQTIKTVIEVFSDSSEGAESAALRATCTGGGDYRTIISEPRVTGVAIKGENE